MQVEEIQYRRANVNDIDVLCDCRVEFLNGLFGNHGEELETKLKNGIKKYLLQAIPSNTFIAWLAEYDKKLIATSGLVIWQVLPKYGVESGKLGYILNMYTLPEARNRGVATQLLNLLVEEAKSMGLTYLHLHASQDGINIYRRAGFSEPEQIELGLKLEY